MRAGARRIYASFYSFAEQLDVANLPVDFLNGSWDVP